MKKIACLLAPHLPVQVEQSRNPGLNGHPVVVGGRPWDPGAVLDSCPRAAAAGVGQGMRLARAQALCPDACFLPADEAAYHAAHQALEAALCEFTDRVETAGLGLFFADVSGPEWSLGRDAAASSSPRCCLPRTKRRGTKGSGRCPACRLAAEAVEALRVWSGQASRLDVRVGLAGARFTAEQAACAARPGQSRVAPPGQEQALLSSLPLSVLPAEPEVIRRLHLLGVRTLGALAGLPKQALVRQFGPRAGLLHDLASGCDPRPVHADAPPLVLEGEHVFEQPLASRAPLAAWAERMVAALAADLACRGYQAEGLRVRLEDDEGDAHAAAAAVEPPTAEGDRLTRRAEALLERLSPPRPVVHLLVTLYPLRPAHLGATQPALFGGPADVPFDFILRSCSGRTHGGRRERLEEAIRRLRERFGEMIVVAGALLEPPPPRPIEVTTDRSGLPCGLVWRDRMLPVAQVYEHWRERRRWWSRPVERNYYRAETIDGQVRVVFRDLGSGRWWLERRHL